MSEAGRCALLWALPGMAACKAQRGSGCGVGFSSPLNPLRAAAPGESLTSASMHSEAAERLCCRALRPLRAAFTSLGRPRWPPHLRQAVTMCTFSSRMPLPQLIRSQATTIRKSLSRSLRDAPSSETARKSRGMRRTAYSSRESQSSCNSLQLSEPITAH